MSTGNLTLPSDEDITNQIKAFEGQAARQAAEDAEKKKRFEETMARHHAQARDDEARRTYASEHRYDEQGNDLRLMGGPLLTPGNTPYGTPHRPNRETPRSSYRGRRLESGRAFGTPSGDSGKTDEQLREEDRMREKAGRQRRYNDDVLKILEELKNLEEREYVLRKYLYEQEQKRKEKEMNQFLSGVDWGTPIRGKKQNTDKTYIKF